MYKVLLINPHLPFNKFTSILHPTLALGYLEPILKQHSFDVEVLDLLISDSPEKELREAVMRFKPDFIGIHAHTQTYCTAIEIANTAKDLLPHCLVGLGGPHPTLDPAGILMRQSSFDVVFRNEAEHSFPLCLRALERRNPLQPLGAVLAPIPAISFRRTDGSVQHNPLSAPIRDFSSFPKCNRGIFNLQWYRKNDPETVLMTSRGCPGTCTFCATRLIGRTYRKHCLDHVFQELDDIQAAGFDSFFIGDDTFACDTEHVRSFCKGYLERGYRMKWTSNLRVVDATEERLALMKQAGAYRVFVGFETFAPNNIDAYDKKITHNASIEAARRIHDAGLEIHGSFMIGGPGDTRGSLLASVPQIRKLELSVVTFNKIIAWPGTAYGRKAEQFGLRYTEDAFWYERKGWLERHPFYTQTLSPEEMDKTARELYWEVLGA